jgi:glycine/D-amino acid oxidase-like deaminating enzyme
LNFKELSISDLRRLNLPEKFVYGVTFGTLVVEQKYYMRYLMEELEKYGVQFEQRRVTSIDEFNSSDYDVVVNCAGLGGGRLVGDQSMYPIRGQVLRVK